MDSFGNTLDYLSWNAEVLMKVFQFGEIVEGYKVPVLNEREIRAAAGIFFTLLLVSVTQIGKEMNFTMLKAMVIVFLLDFTIRVFVNPRFAPSMILGRLMVKNQTPEYVGAPQKKFSWIIGFILALVMFVHLVVFNAYSPITGLSCMFCLVFLFFESAFGICLGCKFYHFFYKEKALYCPGEVCEIRNRQEIQKVSKSQILVLIASVLLLIAVIVLFLGNLQQVPADIFGMQGH